MFSFMFAIICFVAVFSGILSICLISSEPNKAKVSGLISIIAIGIALFTISDRPSPIEVVQEKVVIIDGKAMSASCLNLNVEVGKNLKEGDTIYRIEKLSYWHRGLYWFKEGLNKYEFSLTNPNDPPKTVNNGQIIAIDGLPLEAFDFKRKTDNANN